MPIIRTFGNYILRGHLQAVTAISVLTVCAMMLPLLAYFIVGIPCGLLVLRKGYIFGLELIFFCSLAMAAFALVSKIDPLFTIIFGMSIWFPVYLCSSALRYSDRLGNMILIAGVIGIIYVLAMHSAIGDLTDWWQSVLNNMLEKADEEGKYKSAIELIAPNMNAIVASGIIMTLGITVLISRWWQSVLFYPEGFWKEFLCLDIPRVGIIMLVIGIILSISDDTRHNIGLDILAISMCMYLFQGISVVHRIVAVRNMHRGWLMCTYLLFLILPLQIALLLSSLGISDSLIGKLKKKYPSG